MGTARVALVVQLSLWTLPACAALLPTPAPPAVVSASPASPSGPHEDPSLLPRRSLLSGADRAEVKVSPDGRRIGWLAAVHGAPSLWIAQADDVAKSEAVTEEAAGAVRSWWWAYGSDRAVFERGKSGEEHLFVVDLTKKETKDLTPVAGVHATLVGLSPKRPREALIALNDRDRQVEDIQLVDLATGARTPVQQNDGGYAAWWADDDLRVRYAERQNADASVDVVQPRRGKEPAAPLVHVAVEDTRPFGHVGFDKTGVVLYLEDSRGRDTSALVSFDTRTGNEAVLAQDARADVGPVLVHPTTKAVEAASFEYDRRTWTVVDGSVEGDFYYLQTFGGEAPLRVTSRSLDEQRWIIEYEYADGPPAYYRYDRDPDVPGNPGKATFLFNGKDALEHAKLSAMKPVVIKARDGLDLVSYVTLPLAADPRDEGRPKAPLPLVLLVHDGPWSRTTGEDSRQHQWLANRGYAVLSVNFRGSTGFGKRFVEAANLQWGARMQDDLIDAVKWAVDEKIADPAKLAVMGWGYGGYAALVAMTTTPDAFACGVDASGPVNLLAFMQSLPRYLQPRADEFAHRVGDWRTDDGKRLLVDRSPIAHAAMLKHPLLIEQGKIDPRATEADTAQFVEATKTTRGRVTYAVYGEEGQTLARPANRESFDAITEVFLAECLGGPYEPIGSLAGTTLTVPVGAIYVHGLTEAIGSIGAR